MEVFPNHIPVYEYCSGSTFSLSSYLLGFTVLGSLERSGVTNSLSEESILEDSLVGVKLVGITSTRDKNYLTKKTVN